MAMSNSLRNKLVAAAGGGAMLIATIFLGGKDGVEGRSYEPYKDVAGVWTVCDGHTGADIVKGKTYTDRECDRLLWKDLQPVKKTVDSLVKVPLNEYQRAALYSFTYNVGTGSFSKSTLLKKLNNGDQAGACEELRRWVYAGGMKFRGLMNRRDMERSMCLAESADDLARG
ncbi:lysozyme [Pantoea sp.]|uniref:lysozyme n=1 Tax=Pantoea sp. TaxID=69393 RepID=UPI0031E270E1